MPEIREYTKPRSLAVCTIFSASMRICTMAEIMLIPKVSRVTIKLGHTRLGAKAKI